MTAQRPDVVTFTIAGVPEGKGRPRFDKRGHAYTPRDTKTYEKRIVGEYLHADQPNLAWDRRIAWRGPVVLSVLAMFTPAASWPAWQRELALAGAWPMTKRPDFDNVGKIIADALNGVAWHDDAQIVTSTIRKVYGPTDQLTVAITFQSFPARG